MVTEKKEEATDKKLRDYELIFIVSPELTDEALEAAVNNVTQFITGKGGTVPTIDRWGKRRLAYPIKRFLEGVYVLAQFKMDPAWSRELEGNLEISESMLRHLLVRLDA